MGVGVGWHGAGWGGAAWNRIAGKKFQKTLAAAKKKKKSDNMIVDPTEDVEQLYHAFDTVLMVIKWSLMV